ncbi:MAG: cytochrome b/b6 domain-containing protein [Acetobacteraceae bacterium]|nr:cytochrome b/b6 domain-containing protein [Acetobacteraceae bacterium]
MLASRDAEPLRWVRVKVWDGWVRLFHWALVALVAFSWWTAQTGRTGWHMLSGHAILALLLWRIAWGLVGSETARFSRFLRSPRAALRHLRTLWTGLPKTGMREAETLGHNPAGGWMVVAMLALLLAQVATGLFADDEELYRGPFADWIGFEASQRVTGWHQSLSDILLAAIGVHLLAIALYRLRLGRNLVGPMITGTVLLPSGSHGAAQPPRMAPAARAAALLAAAAGLAGALWRFGGQP